MGKRALAQQQRVEVFAQAIIEGKSQSDAYRAAYPASLKWKAKSVHELASKMAKDTKVLSRVSALRADAIKSWVATVADLTEHWTEVTFADPVGLVGTDGKPRKLHELSPELRRCISSLEIAPDGTLKVRFKDGLRASELLGRNNGAFAGETAQPPAGMGAGNGQTYQQFNFIGATPEEAARMYQAMIRQSQQAVAQMRADHAKRAKGERVR